MKRRILIFLLLIITFPLFALSDIYFSSSRSSLSLKEGHEDVVLSGPAIIEVDSLRIESDKINLTGLDWDIITCTGRTSVVDEERGISIDTTKLWFDRNSELLLISTWFEVEDKKQEVSATGGSLSYNMKDELLELSMQVMLNKVTKDGLMRCQAESVIFDRKNNTLSLKGKAKVFWKGDSYSAEVISVDLDNDRINLEGKIKGDLNG